MTATASCLVTIGVLLLTTACSGSPQPPQPVQSQVADVSELSFNEDPCRFLDSGTVAAVFDYPREIETADSGDGECVFFHPDSGGSGSVIVAVMVRDGVASSAQAEGFIADLRADFPNDTRVTPVRIGEGFLGLGQVEGVALGSCRHGCVAGDPPDETRLAFGSPPHLFVIFVTGFPDHGPERDQELEQARAVANAVLEKLGR